jgi:hypothetical protein
MAAAAAIKYTAEDVDIVVRTAWGESRGEPLECRIGVIWVIRNRVEMPGWWGATPAAVCYKPWQFSCRNQDDPNLPKLLALKTTDPEYLHFQQLVLSIFQGTISDFTRGCTTYKRTGTAASWDKVVDKTPPIVLGHQSFWRLSPDGRIIPLRPPVVEIPPEIARVPEPLPIEARTMSFLSSFILARLQEPSTYAGLGGIALALGMHLSGDQLGAITSMLVAGAGAASAFLPEGKKS